MISGQISRDTVYTGPSWNTARTSVGFGGGRAITRLFPSFRLGRSFFTIICVQLLQIRDTQGSCTASHIKKNQNHIATGNIM